MTRTMLRLMLAATALAAMPAAAQDGGPDAPPIHDRGQWLPRSVPTSDDVLRIPVPADHNAPKGSFVLVGGRLFDGTGAAARPATIVVRGKTIVAVLKPGERDWPADAVVHDVTGKTVMPGLIDLHTHLTYVDGFDAGYGEAVASGADSAMRGIRRMGIFLQSGITSVRDVASHGDVPFVLKRWQAEGRVPGPRVFAAGQLITATGGHGAALNKAAPSAMDAVREASGPDSWREAVRIQFKQGADLIKLASEYSQAEIDAAVAEAHSLGLPVTVDSETQYIDMAVKAGVDSIEHPLPRSDAAIALMARRGIASVPTLIPYRIIQRSSGGYFGSTSRRFELNETTIVEMLRKMRKAGIKMGVGTDLITNWIDYMPTAYIEELKGFVKVGYSNSEALVAATRTNAEILRMADRLGTIEPGKLADVVVLDKDITTVPEDQIMQTNVDMTFVGGKLVYERK